MIDDIVSELTAGMKSSMEALDRELAKRRTGRANVAILDGIRVDYYGTMSPINQVASVQVADAHLITVKPWEKNMVPVIEKALMASSLGLTPNSDGEMLRLPIPPLTEERRRELVRDVKRVGEDAKVNLRGQRRDANEMLRETEKDKDISEDELHRGLAKVQDVTNGFVKKVDEVIGAKEAEILEF